MTTLPEHPHLDHLRTQAKDLLRALHACETAAFERLRASLPAVRDLDDAALAAHRLRLHDAQSCVAREYGFVSWTRLVAHVEASRAAPDAAPLALEAWLRLAYSLGFQAANPELAAKRLTRLDPDARRQPVVACAIGDVGAVRAALATPLWRDTPAGPLAMLPLTAVTLSSLIHLPAHATGLRESARALLEAGADPNVRWTGGQFPESPLSALYGAAGRNADLPMTQLLLAAGADPNDGESLYHATEADDLACLRALLDAGARVSGTNALFHVLDREWPEAVRLLLERGGDPNERLGHATALHWAIRRQRSLEVVEALLAAGADPRASGTAGRSPLQLARRAGLEAVAARLAAIVGDEPPGDRDAFVGACVRADGEAARAELARHPGLLGELEADDLRLLPDCVANGHDDAARLMVELGWPVAARGGDWNASALNLAVFRGEPALTRFLLEHGADWRERHGHHDDVRGTLSFASVAEPEPGGDWLGCAEALLDQGMPVPPAAGDKRWSEAISALFAARRGG